MPHPYDGIRVVLTTKHEKQNLITPAFNRLGIEVDHYEWDTDQLGTFSAEIPRTLSQRDTAIKKARIGMLATKSKYGIASEGTIGPDPALPILNSTLEAIVWVDDVNDFELVEYERGLDIVAVREQFKTTQEIDDFLTRADFPNHALIVYPEGAKEPIYKGVREKGALLDAIDECVARSRSGIAVMESDLRAHMSPSRSAVIARCAEKLVSRLSVLCQSCSLPGFGQIGNLRGLNCEQCKGYVATAISGTILGCVKCDFKIENFNEKKMTSAANCPTCNP